MYRLGCCSQRECRFESDRRYHEYVKPALKNNCKLFYERRLDFSLWSFMQPDNLNPVVGMNNNLLKSSLSNDVNDRCVVDIFSDLCYFMYIMLLCFVQHQNAQNWFYCVFYNYISINRGNIYECYRWGLNI